MKTKYSIVQSVVWAAGPTEPRRPRPAPATLRRSREAGAARSLALVAVAVALQAGALHVKLLNGGLAVDL